jgi:hypothetical protein
MDSKTSKPNPRRALTRGTHVIYPGALLARYGIALETRWRWERDGRLPPRDVFDARGKAIGWRPETLDKCDAGELTGRHARCP